MDIWNALPASRTSIKMHLQQAIWNDVGIDFITRLPQSKGYDAILVVLDRLSKCDHYKLLKHPFSAQTVAELLAKEVVHLHGVPSSIVRDWDPTFIAWSDSVELWFLGQGFHDHLEKQEAEILEENKVSWLKLDYQLCVILWQPISPELLEILRSFKTCYSFWTNARDVFANDVQRLFDSTQKIVFLQQTNHDMVSHIGKVRTVAEELKGLLVCNSVEETTKRIDKLPIDGSNPAKSAS
ncbi:Tf2-9, partial [Mucuna pruriens]